MAVLPVELSLVTNASYEPPELWIAFTNGNVVEPDHDNPVTYALPEESTATAWANSSELPLMSVE